MRQTTLRATIALISVLLLILTMVVTPTPAAAAPQLRLPTPPGEAWRVIQGYGCGTHNGWDHYSLDLVRVEGSTYEAPIYAAADGIIWFWERYSGSLILSHGGGFFTIYTHLSRPVSAVGGQPVAAGEQIGWVSDTGSRGIAHLHFTAYYAGANGWSGRNSVPLSFVDGYQLPETGGCNQHGGRVLRAAAAADDTAVAAADTTVAAAAGESAAAPAVQQLEFSPAAGARSYSVAWNHEPAADAADTPALPQAAVAIGDLPDGIHTLFVRSRFADGSVGVATFGPVMVDRAAPEFAAFGSVQLRLPAGVAGVISWPEALDAVSGVAGYRIYVGADPAGISDWYVGEPMTQLPPLGAGRYVVRLQPIDNTGLVGTWVTYAELLVTP